MPEQAVPGYTEADLEQHLRGTPVSPTQDDVRSPFQHDVDRILYSSEFRTLAGKTQVVAADQLGGYHNRLTHSLKVAQLGRRLATLLTQRAGDGAIGPDPDLLEAACLMHDIGHPPFGHIGERSLAACVDELRNSGTAREEWPDPPSDGFQGNAQNLRIVTYLSARGTRRDQRGMHLTRATLDAATKYPWRRGTASHGHSFEHWGSYEPEVGAVEWILEGGIQESPAEKSDAPARPVEEQIMDWSDEVTYACHDVEDFYRAGLIPLDRIFNFPPEDPRRELPLGYETEQFLSYLEAAAKAKNPEADFDAEEVVAHLKGIENLLLPVNPYFGDLVGKQTTASATSRLLTYFVSDVKLAPASGGDGSLTRYGAVLDVPSDHRAKVKLLKALIHCYVIDRPGLAGQQHGQKRIVRDLTTWVAAEPTRLLPPDRREEFDKDMDAVRSAADYVSSMTEIQALLLHRRMSGVDYGQITDLV